MSHILNYNLWPCLDEHFHWTLSVGQVSGAFTRSLYGVKLMVGLVGNFILSELLSTVHGDCVQTKPFGYFRIVSRFFSRLSSHANSLDSPRDAH